METDSATVPADVSPASNPATIPAHESFTTARFEGARAELAEIFNSIRAKYGLTMTDGLGVLSALTALYQGDYHAFILSRVEAARAAAEQQQVTTDTDIAAAKAKAEAREKASQALRVSRP